MFLLCAMRLKGRAVCNFYPLKWGSLLRRPDDIAVNDLMRAPLMSDVYLESVEMTFDSKKVILVP